MTEEQIATALGRIAGQVEALDSHVRDYGTHAITS